jgi:SAM-dependent methyltransferase
MIDRSLNYGRPVVRRFLEDARPFRSVLDIGAGRGADLLAARGVEPAAALHAVELWPPNVLALQQAHVHVVGLDLEREQLPFESASLDVVIANQVLEHVKEIFWIFHEIARVLRTGGRLILGVPNLASLHNRLLLLAGRQPSVIKSASAHVRGFTRADLLHFLDQAAPGIFRLRAHAGANFYPLPPLLARPLARVLPGLAWGLFLHLEKVADYRGQFAEFPSRAQLETNFRCSPDKTCRHEHAVAAAAPSSWRTGTLPR